MKRFRDYVDDQDILWQTGMPLEIFEARVTSYFARLMSESQDLSQNEKYQTLKQQRDELARKLKQQNGVMPSVRQLYVQQLQDLTKQCAEIEKVYQSPKDPFIVAAVPTDESKREIQTWKASLKWNSWLKKDYLDDSVLHITIAHGVLVNSVTWRPLFEVLNSQEPFATGYIWNVPDYGFYGQRDGTMFGLFFGQEFHELLKQLLAAVEAKKLTEKDPFFADSLGRSTSFHQRTLAQPTPHMTLGYVWNNAANTSKTPDPVADKPKSQGQKLEALETVFQLRKQISAH